MILLALKPKSWYPRIWLLVGCIIVGFSLIYLLSKMTTINGANSWLNVNTISIQPSEFYKSFIILALSVVYGIMVGY